MQSIPGNGAAHNPYSSERTKPGAIPYQFHPGSDLESVIDAFERNGREGQIVGGHGTGKSTLVAALRDEFLRRGRHTVTLEGGPRARNPSQRDTIVIVDSGERIGKLRLRAWAALARRLGGGLIITAHADLGLPTLVTTSVSPTLARGIIEHLVGYGNVPIPPDRAINAAIERHKGNMRLALFELYDRYEAERTAIRSQSLL